MSAEFPENDKNPTIRDPEPKSIAHTFLIKYENEEQRRHFADLVMHLIKKHELQDFHVEEKPAAINFRVIYNLRTITNNPQCNFDSLNTEFVKHFRKKGFE